MNRGSLKILQDDDDDPMLSAVNLVDVFLVLVVALLTAVAAQKNTEASLPEGATVVHNAGKPDMEIVVRENGKDVRFKGAGSASAGQGVRAGTAYRLQDGTMVYLPEVPDVPEAGAATDAPPPAPAR